MKRLILLLTLLPVLAPADPQPWMKKDDVGSLYIDVFSHPECPMTTDEVEKETKNVLIRSRIKPQTKTTWVFDTPYLRVDIQCMKPSDSSSVVFADLVIDFVDLIDLNDPYKEKAASWPNYEPDLILLRHGDAPYRGLLLITDKNSLRSTIRDAVEDFTADYLVVNFDLGEDEQ